MKFYIYDIQKGKGYWMPNYAGYTHKWTEAGLYAANELPTHAADCWIAIPQFTPYHGDGEGEPNFKLVAYLKKWGRLS